MGQKGFDVVVNAWYDLLQRPLRMVVLGTGEPAIQDGFRALAQRAPDRFAVRFAYDNALAHKIEAGADMFLMPSRFEPCGLTQMYSLRYGTVPIVRSTGGLVDTVEPYDEATGARHRLPLRHADGTGLMWALDQALARDRKAWQRLMRNGMTRDFSRAKQAQVDVDLDRRAIARVLQEAARDEPRGPPLEPRADNPRESRKRWPRTLRVRSRTRTGSDVLSADKPCAPWTPGPSGAPRARRWCPTSRRWPRSTRAACGSASSRSRKPSRRRSSTGSRRCRRCWC